MEAIVTEKLAKHYRSNFLIRKFEALGGIDLKVKQGDVFGLIGPNGAGKTTTIKILTGLIYQTSGSARIFDRDVKDTAVHKRFGFLPENPSFYDHLTGLETMHYFGKLLGMSRRDRLHRTEKLLQLVGLESAATRQVRKYSKGMAQRLGLAQALLHDPELIILDEPMSGLDPIGRREVRDIILSLREQGKTIFFSTHILSDVQMICDRIAVLHHGRLVGEGTVEELMSGEVRRTCDLEVENIGEQALLQLGLPIEGLRNARNKLFFAVDEQHLEKTIQTVGAQGGRIKAIYPNRQTLEDIFMELIKD